ncbi:hypothetical protein V5O48_016468 [Marasmius crinis-equi]|uniref:Uncharacterized protein n=1 Tax=Marasmius crinis-equi TaxID=585013 RepID=A0ABR3ERS7_9AGAR
MSGPPPYRAVRDWDIDRLCDAANGVIAVPQDIVWTCEPGFQDSPGLRWKTGNDAKNFYVVFEVPDGDLFPAIYRDFVRDVKPYLPDGSLTNSGVTCKGHPTLQKAEEHWAELCRARHNDEFHRRHRARKTATLEEEANEAKARLVFNSLVQLQPNLLGIGSSEIVSVSTASRVLNPISSPPASPSRSGNSNRTGRVVHRTKWKLFVCFVGGVEYCDNLKSAHRALRAVLERQTGVTGIFLAVSESDARQAFESILASDCSSGSSAGS